MARAGQGRLLTAIERFLDDCRTIRGRAKPGQPVVTLIETRIGVSVMKNDLLSRGGYGARQTAPEWQPDSLWQDRAARHRGGVCSMDPELATRLVDKVQRTGFDPELVTGDRQNRTDPRLPQANRF